MYPVLLDVPGGDWGDALLKAVKEQLRAVPAAASATARCATSDDAADAGACRRRPQVSFNYLGQFDGRAGGGLFDAARCRRAGRSRRPEPALHLLDVVGARRAGRLELTWTYSDQAHDEATVRRLADACSRRCARSSSTAPAGRRRASRRRTSRWPA